MVPKTSDLCIVSFWLVPSWSYVVDVPLPYAGGGAVLVHHSGLPAFSPFIEAFNNQQS